MYVTRGVFYKLLTFFILEQSYVGPDSLEGSLVFTIARSDHLSRKRELNLRVMELKNVGPLALAGSDGGSLNNRNAVRADTMP